MNSSQAGRALSQASLGASKADIDALAGRSLADWITEQMNLPHTTDYVDDVQAQFDLDPAGSYRPGGGSKYTPNWLIDTFWATAVNGPDPLRRRVAHALLHIFVVSLEQSDLYEQARPFGRYLDNLAKNAFGNFRTLIEDVALSPTMGVYLSHMRNEKGDPAKGRLPDENFARELMQLFTIGLYELNIDGTVKLGSNGKPIETYNNNDVMGLARVFTGWAWNVPDTPSQPWKAWWTGPDTYATTGTARFDLLPMKVHSAYHETGIKQFLGVTVPANTSGTVSAKTALDTLFNHPNVGPFIGKQLIQQLVTSNPSPAYVQAVAQAFNNNGAGVRGDMAAVVRAILLHAEARAEPTGQFGKVREPIIRTVQAFKVVGAAPTTARWNLSWDHRGMLQTPLSAPSVFNFYRPGYIPPNTQIATLGMVAPGMQIVNESTVANWVNFVWALLQWGVGWTGTTQAVKVDLTQSSNPLVRAATISDAALADYLNTSLFAGKMSTALRANIISAMQNQVSWNSTTRLQDRCRIGAFIALVSAEYMIER